MVTYIPSFLDSLPICEEVFISSLLLFLGKIWLKLYTLYCFTLKDLKGSELAIPKYASLDYGLFQVKGNGRISRHRKTSSPSPKRWERGERGQRKWTFRRKFPLASIPGRDLLAERTCSHEPVISTWSVFTSMSSPHLPPNWVSFPPTPSPSVAFSVSFLSLGSYISLSHLRITPNLIFYVSYFRHIFKVMYFLLFICLTSV